VAVFVAHQARKMCANIPRHGYRSTSSAVVTIAYQDCDELREELAEVSEIADRLKAINMLLM
jgi:ACT domain-containing protein